MTPHTPTFRLHTFLALAVLAVGLGSQAWGYHGCAGHAGGTPGHAVHGAEAVRGSHDGHEAHAARAPDRALDHQAPAHTQHSEGSQGAGHGPCTCLGTCHGSATATTLPPMAPEAPTVVVVRLSRVQATNTRAPVVRPAFLIPYSTAPPLSV